MNQKPSWVVSSIICYLSLTHRPHHQPGCYDLGVAASGKHLQKCHPQTYYHAPISLGSLSLPHRALACPPPVMEGSFTKWSKTSEQWCLCGLTMKGERDGGRAALWYPPDFERVYVSECECIWMCVYMCMYILKNFITVNVITTGIIHDFTFFCFVVLKKFPCNEHFVIREKTLGLIF